MALCVKCGKEGSSCLCEACKPGTDLEKLCMDIIAYRPGSGGNPIWDRISRTMHNQYHFKNIVFALSGELPSPGREYIRVMGVVGAAANVRKESRPWFYARYEAALETGGMTEQQKNRLHGIALGALTMDYQYEAAGTIAEKLRAAKEIPWQASFNLVRFYLTTRQYDKAEEAISAAEQRFTDDTFVMETMERLSADLEKRRSSDGEGGREYLPNPKTDRESAVRSYKDYLVKENIPVRQPKRKIPKPIPNDQYPDPIETRDADFDAFVAFDLETTGTDPRRDSILEIGAIKVVGGKLVESAEFTFRELAKPYDRKLSEGVKELTGITPEDVKDARQMWEVFADFMDFAGDSVLVGFNCVAFDGKFLKRAGRYSHIVMENKLFDVMRYAGEFRERLGISEKRPSLETVSQALGVENPRAHRALPDAVTTAKVFLKLREMDEGPKDVGLSDLLSDLDAW